MIPGIAICCTVWWALAPGGAPAAVVLPQAEPTAAIVDTATVRAHAENPCAATYLTGKSWIDWVHRRVHRTACESALWFDNLFGDRAIYDERDQTHGRVRAGVVWDEREGVDSLLRFRVHWALPRMENRLQAIVGRDDQDELIADRGSSSGRVPVFFGDPDEDEWLLGLGYNPYRETHDRFDFGVGARVAAPPEPYVKASFRHLEFFGSKSLGRFRQTVFWESEDGLGTTSRLDLERVLGEGLLVRWRSSATVSAASQGAGWFSSVSLYHRLGRVRGLAYEVGVRGETDADVPLREAGVRLIYRQRIFRDWLYLDVRPGLAWRREEVDEAREPIPALGVAFEMQFGDY